MMIKERENVSRDILILKKKLFIALGKKLNNSFIKVEIDEKIQLKVYGFILKIKYNNSVQYRSISKANVKLERKRKKRENRRNKLIRYFIMKNQQF